MTIGPYREMRPHERQVLDSLLSQPFPGRDELVQQLRNVMVRSLDENGSLEFLVTSGVKAASVRYRVPTEGEYEDSDGVIVHVLLHVVSDFAKELEVFREDNGVVMTWPQSPDVVRVFAPK